MNTVINNSKPAVSVLMPAYNAEAYINEAIESILGQSFEDFELIIADDCSKDNTWRIIQNYARKDRRIMALRNENNLGIAGNRNGLVSKAIGKYVAWQDADDISMPDRLKHQFELMEKDEAVGICGGWLEFFNENGRSSLRKYKEDDVDLRKMIFRYSPVAQPSAMLRREVFEKVGLYDLNYPPAEDLDMSFRIGKEYRFANLQEVTIRYRESGSSATFTKLKTIELKTISIRLRYSDSAEYKMTTLDHIYNICQYISVLMVPPRMKILLFNLLRNSHGE